MEIKKKMRITHIHRLNVNDQGHVRLMMLLFREWRELLIHSQVPRRDFIRVMLNSQSSD